MIRSASVVKNTPYGKSRTSARRASSSMTGNWNGFSKTLGEELGLGREVEPPHSANGAEARQQLPADLRPGARGHLPAPVRSETFGNDLAMPVRDRHVLWALSEMVPERLNVFELLVRRELVEARGRKRRLRHDASISPCNRFNVGALPSADLPFTRGIPGHHDL